MQCKCITSQRNMPTKLLYNKKEIPFLVNSFLSRVLKNNKTFLPSGARTPIDYIVINFTYCVVLRGSPIEGQFLHLLLTMILIRIRKTLSFSFCYISKQNLVPFLSLRICVLYIAIQRKNKMFVYVGNARSAFVQTKR